MPDCVSHRFLPPWWVDDPDTKLGRARDADGHKAASPGPPKHLLTFQPSTIGLLLRCRGSQGGLSPWKAYIAYLASMALAGGHFILVRNAVRP